MSTDPRVLALIGLVDHYAASADHDGYENLPEGRSDTTRTSRAAVVEGIGSMAAEIVSLSDRLKQAGDDFAAMKALAENGAAEISRLTAELEEARKDAGRLDHLQSKGATVDLVGLSEDPSIVWFRVGGLHYTIKRDIRESIDAAMTKEKSPLRSRPLTDEDFPPHLD